MWDAIGYAVIGAVVAILAVRVRVSFNLNDYLENRRTRKRQRQCEHYRISAIGEGRLYIDCFLDSPRGTLDLFCHGCGIVTTRGGFERVMDHARQEVLQIYRDAGVDTSKLKWEEPNLSD